MTDKMTGKPRGFGFVTFADSVVVENIQDEEHVIDDRKVDLKRTVPRDEMGFKGVSKTKKIFVGGLPPFLTEDELKEYFSFYGDIIEHQIMYDHNTGRSRGFGFVTFQTEEAVDIIIYEGKIHELGDKHVEIKRAEPRRNGRDQSSRSHGSGGRYEHEDGYSGKANGDYSLHTGYGGFGGYGTYPGNYMGGTAGFYGFGGYGYGGPMYSVGYGAGAFSQMGGYGSTIAYGGAKGYGIDENSSSSVKGNGTNYVAATRYHPCQKQ